MIETRSALAELAERITEVLASYQDDMYLEHRQTLDMAQRIVAELAKVSDWHWQVICDDFCTTGDFELHCAIGRCLAIAEEGVKDGFERD